MSYNITNLTQANDLFSMAKEVNNLTTGFMSLGVAILLMVFIVVFALARLDDLKTRFLVSSFLTSFVAILFYFIEFINLQSMIIPIILLLVSLFTKIFMED